MEVRVLFGAQLPQRKGGARLDVVQREERICGNVAQQAAALREAGGQGRIGM